MRFFVHTFIGPYPLKPDCHILDKNFSKKKNFFVKRYSRVLQAPPKKFNLFQSRLPFFSCGDFV